MTLQTSWMPCWSEIAVFVRVVVSSRQGPTDCFLPLPTLLVPVQTIHLLLGPFRVWFPRPPRNICLTLAQTSNVEYLRIVLNRGSMEGGQPRGGTSHWAQPFQHQDQFQNALAEQIPVTTWIEMTAVC